MPSPVGAFHRAAALRSRREGNHTGPVDYVEVQSEEVIDAEIVIGGRDAGKGEVAGCGEQEVLIRRGVTSGSAGRLEGNVKE